MILKYLQGFIKYHFAMHKVQQMELVRYSRTRITGSIL